MIVSFDKAKLREIYRKKPLLTFATKAPCECSVINCCFFPLRRSSKNGQLMKKQKWRRLVMSAVAAGSCYFDGGGVAWVQRGVCCVLICIPLWARLLIVFLSHFAPWKWKKKTFLVCYLRWKITQDANRHGCHSHFFVRNQQKFVHDNSACEWWVCCSMCSRLWATALNRFAQ